VGDQLLAGGLSDDRIASPAGLACDSFCADQGDSASAIVNGAQQRVSASPPAIKSVLWTTESLFHQLWCGISGWVGEALSNADTGRVWHPGSYLSAGQKDQCDMAK
jgi:hypothetical protein